MSAFQVGKIRVHSRRDHEVWRYNPDKRQRDGGFYKKKDSTHIFVFFQFSVGSKENQIGWLCMLDCPKHIGRQKVHRARNLSGPEIQRVSFNSSFHQEIPPAHCKPNLEKFCVRSKKETLSGFLAAKECSCELILKVSCLVPPMSRKAFELLQVTVDRACGTDIFTCAFMLSMTFI